MQGIVDGITRVSSIMNEIVGSSREQASGIAQVNQAIEQMDGTTQQNAALVEESAAATLSMQEQATALTALVALFQVEAAAHPGSTTTARAARVVAPVRHAAKPVPTLRDRAPTRRPARQGLLADASH
jgi:methyl-accepting chemotaxis protein